MKTMEELLKEKLLPDCDPAQYLNASILKKAKETQIMKQKTFRSSVAAAAAVMIIAAGSVSAYAAYHYLTPSQVAKKMTEESSLAKAFESKDAVLIDETLKSAGYDVTLMGIVTGKDLVPVVEKENKEKISQKKTYVIVSIAREDGSDMPDLQAEDYQTFCTSALIHGARFVDINNATLNAGVQSFVQDGVQYQLLECDNLEIFANKGVYLGVVENFGQESEAFTMDKKTGDYTMNESYDGLKALFSLPLDKTKADDKAAEKYLEKINEQETQDAETEQLTGEEKLADKWMKQMCKLNQNTTQKKLTYIKEYTEVVLKETYTPNSDGNIHIQSDCEVGDYNTSQLPKQIGVEMINAANSDGTLLGTYADSFIKNEDGTYTYTVYRPANI